MAAATGGAPQSSGDFVNLEKIFPPKEGKKPLLSAADKKTEELVGEEVLPMSSPRTPSPTEEHHFLSPIAPKSFPDDITQQNFLKVANSQLEGADEILPSQTREEEVHNAYALHQAQQMINEAAEAANYAPIFPVRETLNLDGHDILFLEDKVIITGIAIGKVRDFILKLQAAAKDTNTKFPSHKSLIDKLNAGSAHPIDRKTKARADRIGSEVACAFLSSLHSKKTMTPSEITASATDSVSAAPIAAAGGTQVSPKILRMWPPKDLEVMQKAANNALLYNIRKKYLAEAQETAKKQPAEKIQKAPPTAVPVGAKIDIKGIRRIAETDHYVAFYNHDLSPIAECFGNFFESPVTVDEFEYRTAEGAFHAQKTNDTEHKRKLQTLTGEEAVKYKKTMDKPPEGWEGTNGEEGLRDIAMRKVIQAKFAERTILAGALLATGNAYLVEHNPGQGSDKYWSDGPDHKGNNKLGELLMEQRDWLFRVGHSGQEPPPRAEKPDFQKVKYHNSAPAQSLK